MAGTDILPHKQIVWFLAPTVPLCYQQFYAISSQIQGAQGRIIAGKIDIKAWSTQAVWYAFEPPACVGLLAYIMLKAVL